jgi:hypothetical protein
MDSLPPGLKNEQKAEKVHALSLYDRSPLVLSRKRESGWTAKRACHPEHEKTAIEVTV